MYINFRILLLICLLNPINIHAEDQHSLIILEGHRTSFTSSFMLPMMDKMKNAMKTYKVLVDSHTISHSAVAIRYINVARNVNKISGNNQDIILALINALSNDIDYLINSVGNKNPEETQKTMIGIIGAMDLHDSLLDSLKMKQNFLLSLERELSNQP